MDDVSSDGVGSDNVSLDGAWSNGVSSVGVQLNSAPIPKPFTLLNLGSS